jgi:ketosteroid isomerase-like protein
MSQENVEIVRKAYEAWEPAWGSGTSDLGALLALMDDDLVCRTHAPFPDPTHLARPSRVSRYER